MLIFYDLFITPELRGCVKLIISHGYTPLKLGYLLKTNIDMHNSKSFFIMHKIICEDLCKSVADCK